MKTSLGLLAIVVTLSTSAFATLPKSMRVVGNIPMTLRPVETGFFFEEFWGFDRDGGHNDNTSASGGVICGLETAKVWMPSAVGQAFLGGSAHVHLKPGLVFTLARASSIYVGNNTVCDRWVLSGEHDDENNELSTCVASHPVSGLYRVNMTLALGPTDARMEATCHVTRPLNDGTTLSTENLLSDLSTLFVGN